MAARNANTNAVSRVAYALAGGKKGFYALPQERRVALREHAQFLHEQGTSFERVAAHIEESVTEGFIYVISNPAWPGTVKIGCAIDVESRLKGFQTGSPARDYRLEHAIYTSDRRATEKVLHQLFDGHRMQGEWFAISVDDAIEMLDEYAEFNPILFDNGVAA